MYEQRGNPYCVAKAMVVVRGQEGMGQLSHLKGAQRRVILQEILEANGGGMHS